MTEIENPVPAQQMTFECGGHRYNLQPSSEHWMLYRHRFGKVWSPIATVKHDENGYTLIDRTSRGHRPRTTADTFAQLVELAL